LAFGDNAPDQNPSGLGIFEYNLRFPGQYADVETGLNQNYFRNYSPMLGRYAEPDPLGFVNNASTYAYVTDNPISFTDATGLDQTLGGYPSSYFPQIDPYEASIGMSVLAGAVIPELFLNMAIPAETAITSTQYCIIAKNGTKITGFTKHGINRAIGDTYNRAGTRPEAILDALKNPQQIQSRINASGQPSQIFIGENARVVVNPQTNKIITTNPLSGIGAH
jgi:RHS repeat-associated protein